MCGYDLRGMSMPCTCPECGTTISEEEAATHLKRVRYGWHWPDRVALALVCAGGAGMIALLFVGTINHASGLSAGLWSTVFVVVSGLIGLAGVRVVPRPVKRTAAAVWLYTFPVLHLSWIAVIPFLWVSEMLGLGWLGAFLGLCGAGGAIAGWYQWTAIEWEKAGLAQANRRLFMWFAVTAVLTGLASLGWCFYLYVVSFGDW